MRQKTTIVVVLCIAILGVWAAGLDAGNCQDGNSQPRRPSRAQPIPPPPPTVSIPQTPGQPTRPRAQPIPPPPPTVSIAQTPGQPTRLQVDVFELTCTSDQLAALNLDTIIADEATPNVILERLRKVGDARLVVRMDDTVDLLQKSRLTYGKQVPVIRDVVVGKGGAVTPSVNYQDVGFIANLNGRWRADDSPWADIVCNLELSGVVLSHVEVSSGVKLPAHIKFKVEKNIAVRNGKPVFTMSNGVPLPDDEQGTVNIALIRFQATRLAE